MNKVQIHDTEIFRNGFKATKTGQLTLVFKPTGELAPIALAKTAGPVEIRGTYQLLPVVGDILIRKSWNTHSGVSVISINKEGCPQLSSKEQVDIIKFLEVNNPDLQMWLTPATWPHGAIFIPAPDVDWLCNVAKRKRLETFTRKTGIELPWDNFKVSRKDDIELHPKVLDELLEEDFSNLLPVEGDIVTFYTTQKGQFTVVDKYSYPQQINKLELLDVVGNVPDGFLVMIKTFKLGRQPISQFKIKVWHASDKDAILKWAEAQEVLCELS